MFLTTLLLSFFRRFSYEHERINTDAEKASPTVEKQKGTLDGSHFHQNTVNALFIPQETRSGRSTPALASLSNQPLAVQTPLSGNTPEQGKYGQTQIPDSQSSEVRLLPLVSCIFVPFSILLAIPGLTDHWYVQTDSQHNVIEFQHNPLYIEVMLGLSMACAIITNACLLIRLLERRVKKMTITCIIALSIHDILDAVVVIMFIIKTQTDDGFSLGQAFWMTLCSTIASLATNGTLILDYWRTSEAGRHKSGLTAKQRSLTIIIILLLCYIAFGAAVHTALLHLSFIDALYFTVVCIETVGFGDIDPQTVGARLFSSVFTAVGILILAVAIGLIRDALLEAIHANLYARVRRARRRRIMRRWTGALKYRLMKANLPVWIPVDHEGDLDWPSELEVKSGRCQRLWWQWSDFVRVKRGKFPRYESYTSQTARSILERSPTHMRLNLWALGQTQLQASAMEAGAPLCELLPRHPDSMDHVNHHESCWKGGSEPVSPTHRRLGSMVAFLGTFAYTVSIGQSPPRAENREDVEGFQQEYLRGPMTEGLDESGTGLTAVELEREERRMFAIRLTFALCLFLTFWLVGSAIFTVTENWSYGLALYFCFVTFSTVGYGDPVPKTPAGRSFFVGWALFGIGAMTILISLLADRYSERYKDIIAAAESTIEANEKGEQRNNSTSYPPSQSLMPIDEGNATSQEGSSNVHGETYEIPTDGEVLSRFDSLKALIADEGVLKEGRLLHTLESELQSMLSLIRRSQKQANPDS